MRAGTEAVPVGLQEAPLLVASNRLPILLRDLEQGWRAQPASGGLVTALDPVLQRRGGTWIGWPGTLEGEVDDLPHVLERLPDRGPGLTRDRAPP